MAGATGTDWAAEAAAAERTEAARRLFEKAQEEGDLRLAILNGMQLCTLGREQQVLFDEAMAKAWKAAGRRNRDTFTDASIRSLQRRGLLLPKWTGEHKPRAPSYSVSPELGIVLAARCRPSFVLTHESVARKLRSLRCFAVGDDRNPVRGIVQECPMYEISRPLEPDLGPMVWMYEYCLSAPQEVAKGLAGIALFRDALNEEQEPRVQVFSGFRRGTPDLVRAHAGIRLFARGLGDTGQLLQPDGRGGMRVIAEYDREGMTAVMADFLSVLSR